MPTSSACLFGIAAFRSKSISISARLPADDATPQPSGVYLRQHMQFRIGGALNGTRTDDMMALHSWLIPRSRHLMSLVRSAGPRAPVGWSSRAWSRRQTLFNVSRAAIRGPSRRRLHLHHVEANSAPPSGRAAGNCRTDLNQSRRLAIRSRCRSVSTNDSIGIGRGDIVITSA